MKEMTDDEFGVAQKDIALLLMEMVTEEQSWGVVPYVQPTPLPISPTIKPPAWPQYWWGCSSGRQQ